MRTAQGIIINTGMLIIFAGTCIDYIVLRKTWERRGRVSNEFVPLSISLEFDYGRCVQ